MARGFTLIELLAVLAILALLAGIAGVTYFGRLDAARVQKVEADLGTIATALSLYRLDTGGLPTTAQGLGALREPPRLEPRPSRYKNGGYIADLPLDPWGRPYLYMRPAQDGAREFDLYTLGADGRAGGEGQDADIYR